MRALNERFLADLESGILAPLTEEVRSDHTLCLELRGSYVNVYYRGGNLMKIEEASNGYSVEFDKAYFKKEDDDVELPRREIQEKADIAEWLGASPHLKRAMDRHFAGKERNEREFQQLVVRDNNFSKISNSTDYFICDIEYADDQRKWQFDMITVHWPSSPSVRKKADERRLVFVKMKYDDSAILGNAGLCKHIQDINGFLGDLNTLKSLKRDL